VDAVVTYESSFELWDSYPSTLVDLAKEHGVQAVGELGGGANPLLADASTWGFVPTRAVYDISVAEMDKAGDDLDKRQADLCQPLGGAGGEYDLVFSRMLCEHLPDPETFHRNCFHLLRPGGRSVHFFPTLYALPFVLNRLVPEQAARRLLSVVQPDRLDNPLTEKFPAYYRWCRGPTGRSLRRYEELGFEVERWRAGFGHSYYRRLGPVDRLEAAKTSFLLRRPVPALTSFAALVLRKPG
jgi:SAM-dependent methyltransferase